MIEWPTPVPGWSTLALRGREWRDEKRLLEAFTRATPSGAVTVTAAALSAHLDDSDTSEAHWGLWLSSSGRARAEFLLGSELVTVVVDKDRWWSWSPALGARSDGTNFGTGLGPGLIMVEPGPLRSRLRLNPVAERWIAGRRGVVAISTPLDAEEDLQPVSDPIDTMPAVSIGPALSEVGLGADTYEFVIDTELGVLLRTEALLQGEPFRICEIVQLSVDEPLDSELFTLVPPSGVAFQEM